MTGQCLQQCLQCLHSAYSSAIKNRSFPLVNDVQCLQCLQLPTTQIHMRAHAHVSSLLCRELMALVALPARDLREQPVLRALFAGTAVALVVALPFTSCRISGGAR
jgi:hypothetical protein